jgi:hypothetical protein
MDTLYPNGNNNNDNNEELPLSGEEYRNRVIPTFSLAKQFAIRTQLKNAEALKKEEAIELLKDFIVHLAQKDAVVAKIIKTTF